MSELIKDAPVEGEISETSDTISVRRTWFLSDVTGSAASRPWSALTDGRIPPLGTAHEVVPGTFLTRRNVRPVGDDPGNYLVELLFEKREGEQAVQQTQEITTGQTVELIVNTIQEPTIRDKNNDLMRVTWVGDFSGQTFLIQTLSFQKLTPTTTIKITRVENTIPKEVIINKLVGTVNAVPWSTFPAQQVLFKGISTTERPDGKHNVVYEFLHNSAGFRTEGFITVNGQIPDNISAENGITTFDVYEDLDFAILGVSF